MKKTLLLLLLAIGLGFTSCQKEVISNEAAIASNNNANPNNFEKDVPFIGEYITTHELLAGPSLQRITGHGQATHLGQNTFVATATLNFGVPPPFPFSGTATFTAANGDQFFTVFTGTSTPTGSGTSQGLITHTIVGGTGRFDDVTGSLIGISLVNAANPTNTVSYEGWINY